MKSKTSFILHLDSLVILDEMTNEQKGILFNAIYKYNLGEEIELDFAMKMAFTPFKNQFIRDEDKWSDIKEGKSISGRKGNLKRYNIDLYTQVIDNQITLEEAEELAKGRKCEISDSEESQNSQSVAEARLNKSVSVSNSVSKNVNTNINYENLKIFWNKTFADSVIPKIDKITTKRKKNIELVLKSYSKEQITIAINKLKNSKICSGDNNTGWIASFDFLFNINNFTKTFEGNYDNKEKTNISSPAPQRQQSAILELTEEEKLEMRKQAGLV